MFIEYWYPPDPPEAFIKSLPSFAFGHVSFAAAIESIFGGLLGSTIQKVVFSQVIAPGDCVV